MTYKEDFVIDKKYLNLIHKCIYSAELDMFGMITEIAVTNSGMYFKAYFDKIHDDRMILFEDFKNGKMKFVIITDMDFPKKFNEEYINETFRHIKEFLGEDFSEDKIIYQTNDEHKQEIREKDELEICRISNDLLNLKRFSAEIFYDNYSTIELYKKYASGAITETELIYGACNYLCEEIKRLKEDNLNYFIEKYNHEEKEFLIEYASRKEKVEMKSKGFFNDNEKENMFKVLDVLSGEEANE